MLERALPYALVFLWIYFMQMMTITNYIKFIVYAFWISTNLIVNIGHSIASKVYYNSKSDVLTNNIKEQTKVNYHENADLIEVVFIELKKIFVILKIWKNC